MGMNFIFLKSNKTKFKNRIQAQEKRKEETESQYTLKQKRDEKLLFSLA